MSVLAIEQQGGLEKPSQKVQKQKKTLKSSRNGHFMDATGWESIPRGQKMMADSIFDVLEA